MPWHGNPARDAAGNVLPHDDSVRLPNRHHVVRHVLSALGFVDFDENHKCLRATSAAFRFSTSGSFSMSADALEQLVADGLQPDHFAKLAGKRGAKLAIDDVRKERFRVGPEPIAGNDYHCGIWQSVPPLNPSQTKKACRELSRAAVLL